MNSIEDDQFPTAKKINHFILENFEEGLFKSNSKQGFIYLGLFGFLVSKVSWFLRKVPQFYEDDWTGEITAVDETVFQCPLIQPVKPHKLLPDPNATDMNIQRWSGIGHKSTISYYTAMERFDNGVYNLNRQKFKDRWDPKEQAVHSVQDEVMEDEDRWQYAGGDRVSQIEVIEWHGAIPKKGKWVEHVATLLQEHNPGQDAQSALMVRLREGTAVQSGYRPYVGAHFTPTGKPFGLGAVEPHLPLIHHLSELLAIMTDNAKVTVQGMWQVRDGSEVSDFLRDNPEASVAEAGKAFHVAQMDRDIKRLESPRIDMGSLSQIYQYNNNVGERAWQVSDTTLGLGQREKTAHEAQILEQASTTPLSNIADMLRESYLNPLGKVVASMYQQFEMADRQLILEGPDGRPQVVTLTQEEIKTGIYKIDFLLDTQDQLRIARVNSMVQLLPILMQLDPMFMRAGKQMRWDLFAERLLDMAGMDRIGDFLTQINPQMPQQMMMQAMMGQQGLPQQPGGPPRPDIQQQQQAIQDQMRLAVQPAPLPPAGPR